MRHTPRYDPPDHPVWLLYLLFGLSGALVVVYLVVLVSAADAPPQNEPACTTHLECPVDSTP